MRILTVGNMYPPHHLGGYELTWQSAVAEMRAAGHEVRVLTTSHRQPGVSPDQEDEPGVSRELRWYWRDHDYPRMGPRTRLALERHNASAFERHVRELDPEVVSWWPMGGMSLSLIGRWAGGGRPAVGVVEDDWMVYGPLVDAWTRMWRRPWAPARLAGRATGLPARLDLGGAHWIFASEGVRRAAQERHRLDSTEVAHLGIDHSLFRPAPAHEWGWRLLYLGRIDPRKGIATCIEALELLPDRATLTIAGSGDPAHAAEMRSLAAGMSVSERVEFVARPREEVPGLYARADALLFPVRWDEPWGLVPLEAMAVGTPVVATGTGGSGEYLRHERNCLLFDRAQGAGGLAAAITRLASEPSLREELRTGGLETAARFPQESFNRAVLAAIERQVAG